MPAFDVENDKKDHDSKRKQCVVYKIEHVTLDLVKQLAVSARMMIDFVQLMRS